jgi:hypothetical protein
MKKVGLIAFIILICALPSKLWSQTQKTDTANVDRYICIDRADMETYCPGLLSDLEKKYGPTLGVNPKVKSASKIAGLSLEVGTAVNDALSSLTNRTEQIAKTNAGKLTLYMIAYKIMGKSLVRLTVGIPILLLFIFLFIAWWAKIGVPQIIPKKTNTAGEFTTELKHANIGEQLLWGCIFLVAIWIIIAIIV